MIPTQLLLEKGAICKKMQTGEILFQENSPSNFYFQIETGRVRISNFLDDGKEVLHKMVCANEGLGELAILDAGLHIATAVADSPCTVYKINSSSFLEILREYPSIHMLITQEIAHDLRFKIFLTKLICNACPEEIITQLLHRLNQERRLICTDCNRLMLTRQQLANMTGLRVETVIRTMKMMEKSDKLQIIRGKVFVPSDGIE